LRQHALAVSGASERRFERVHHAEKKGAVSDRAVRKLARNHASRLPCGTGLAPPDPGPRRAVPKTQWAPPRAATTLGDSHSGISSPSCRRSPAGKVGRTLFFACPTNLARVSLSVGDFHQRVSINLPNRRKLEKPTWKFYRRLPAPAPDVQRWNKTSSIGVLGIGTHLHLKQIQYDRSAVRP